VGGEVADFDSPNSEVDPSQSSDYYRGEKGIRLSLYPQVTEAEM